MKLLFSVYKTDIWKFGEDGVYYALGPFRLTKLAFLDATGGIDSRMPPVIERVIDYEYHPSLREDKFVLFLEDGNSVERKYSRSTQDKYIEGERLTTVSSPNPVAKNFLDSLQERCGY